MVNLPQAPLNNLLRTAHSYGVPSDQITRFIQAGYIPQPKQLQFHAAARLADLPNGPTRIALGGARGPGKSHSSITQVVIDDCQRYPGLKVLFLRQVGKSAKESFSDLRERTLKHTPHDYKEHSGRLFLPNGSRVIIGNFNRESDINKYIGIEYDVIVVEEATQLSEKKINELRGSLRTSKPNWRPRMYFTTNPGGIGHQWFKRWFVQPWRRGEERDTRFIPSNYKDNAFLNREYIDYLESLTGVLGRMWRDGDWDIGAGQFFVNWDYDLHVIRPFTIPEHWPIWASLDYGFSHPTAVYWHTKSDDGIIYTIAEHVKPRWLVAQHARAIKDITGSFNHMRVSDLEAFPAGRDCFIRSKDREAKSIAEQYAAEGIKLHPAEVNRINGAAELLKRLGNPEAGISPTWFIFDTCVDLIDCLPGLQTDPNRPEDVLKVDADMEGVGGDDPYDSVRYGLMTP
ncbi:MAG: phage terminase large subunit, partial [Anaerolineales bacterium]|nr:phage terminase large subunit [Anaerolineales bacterium]